jgi:ATP-binding cassette subfamily B (MDR/TAP) protein 1
MGNGLVLEEGTHDELLSRGGAYAGLVQAQKLRETAQVDEGSDSDTRDEPDDVEKLARGEVPLGRKDTEQSLASEIIKQRNKERDRQKEADYSLTYLFLRMGKINREDWRRYLVGTMGAIGTLLRIYSTR